MKIIYIFLVSVTLFCGCDSSSRKTGMSNLSVLNKSFSERVYNVKDFNVRGDGVTDDTEAIQKVLDYVMDHGGGTIYFPKGLYRLATIQERYRVKGHLIIKPKSRGSGIRDYVMIKLTGENCVVTPCSYANHTSEDKAEVWKNGTVLFSDTLGELYTDTNELPVSVLAVGTGDNLYSMNQAVVRLQDLAFQVKAEEGKYPYLSGVNMAYAATVYTDNVLIYSSVRNVALTSPSRDGHFSAGFIGPHLWCNPEQELRNIYVKSAFRYGFVFSEHMNGNNLSAWNCDNAYVFSKMDHSCWFGRIHAQNCKNIITSLDKDFAGHTKGQSFLQIQQVGIEVNSGQDPKDFNYEHFVVDPDNLLYGSFSYHIVKSNVGADNNYYSSVGADNMKALSLY